MPAWLTALIAAVWEVLKPWVMPVGAGVVGSELQKGQEARETLDKVYEADKAVAAARGWSPADRVRYLERRGRMRDIS